MRLAPHKVLINATCLFARALKPFATDRYGKRSHEERAGRNKIAGRKLARLSVAIEPKPRPNQSRKQPREESCKGRSNDDCGNE